MEKHKCKLCSRRFGSGRALGGHMRSHFTILPVPPKPHPSQLSETSSSSYSQVNKSPTTKLLEEDSVVVDDGESETESRKTLIPSGSTRVRKWRRRRSESSRRLLVLGGEKNKKTKRRRSSDEFGQAVSETASSEEDLAMCLMLLSRDKWVRKECPAGSKRDQIYLENGTGGDDEKIHECPVCYKVFKSGQALGGHKRSHLFSSTSSTAATATASANNNVWLIDLNLPAAAPIDDAGGDMSHIHIPVSC